MDQSDTLARAQRYANRVTTFLTPGAEFSDADVVTTLQKLDKLDVNLNILTSTGIGKKVNELRKKPIDENVQKLCKNLVKKWKSLLDAASANPSTESVLKRKLADESSESSATPGSSQPAVDSRSPNNAGNGHGADSEENSNDSFAKRSKGVAEDVNKRRTAASNAGAPATNLQEARTPTGGVDPQRQGFRQMLISSLQNHEPQPEGALNAVEIGNAIEEVIHSSLRSRAADDIKYKNKIRAKVKALRDSKNPALREMILTGAISAERFVNMSAEEMASDEVKALRKKLTQEAINDHQLSVQQGTETEMFKCSKCKSNKCTYTQLQTRSSDEPMTTFVVCLSCGNRWKFC